VLYKVLPNVSVYYNYSTDNALASANPLWQAGVQNEFGVKASFFNDRINVSADHFEIVESNLSYQNPLFNLGLSTIVTIYTDLANHGYEFNAQGGVTKDLSAIVSLTSQKLRDFVGRQQRNVPDTMMNALLDYHFNVFSSSPVKNSDVFAGVIHQSKVAGENVTGFTALGVAEQPGYFLAPLTVYHAGAGYTVDNYRFNLNVDNVFNQHFWMGGQSRISAQPYPGITVTLTVTIHML
jgi:iron complex outermembrane receptor protein